jgi:hypothetical protein
MLIVLIAVHLAASILFALNYLRFDVGLKNFDSVYSKEASTTISHLKMNFSYPTTPSGPVFDRLAFVLLDAWRWDFCCPRSLL